MLKRILPILFVLGILASCDENAVEPSVSTTIAPNELQALTANSFMLDREQAGEVFQEFSWTAPDFGFPASITYTLELDKAGNNFAAPVNLLSTQETTAAITVEEMNKKLLDLELTPDEAAAVELRVSATVSEQVQPVYSTVQSFSITPYATVFPPIYVIGADISWDLARAVRARSIAPSVHETTAHFTNGNNFRFFADAAWEADQLNWDSFAGGTVDTKLSNANDGDKNFLFNGTTGWYKLTADVKNKSIVMEPVDRPTLYIIGSGQSWALENALALKWINDGVYQVETSFAADETFRFFTKPDWSTGTINYPYFADGSVDPRFENAGGDDNNFKFVGTPGTFTVTVDLHERTFIVTE